PILERRTPGSDLRDDLLRERDRSLLVPVQNPIEHPALRVTLEVECVRSADLVPADDHLAPELLRPRDLAGVPLLPPVAEEGFVDLVDLHRYPAAGEP